MTAKEAAKNARQAAAAAHALVVGHMQQCRMPTKQAVLAAKV